MTFKELKNWVNNLPEKFDEYSVVNAEFKEIDDQFLYRLDKPVTMITVDEENKEILLLNDEIPEEDEISERG